MEVPQQAGGQADRDAGDGLAERRAQQPAGGGKRRGLEQLAAQDAQGFSEKR
jgi:hypothetical protein